LETTDKVLIQPEIYVEIFVFILYTYTIPQPCIVLTRNLTFTVSHDVPRLIVLIYYVIYFLMIYFHKVSRKVTMLDAVNCKQTVMLNIVLVICCFFCFFVFSCK